MICRWAVNLLENRFKTLGSFFFIFTLLIPATMSSWAQPDNENHSQAATSKETASVTEDHGEQNEEKSEGKNQNRKIAAIVNGVPIMQDTLEEAVEWLKMRKQAQDGERSGIGQFQHIEDGIQQPTEDNTTTASGEDSIRATTLKRLIDEELAVQEAKRMGIRVPPGTIRSVTSMLRYQKETATPIITPATLPDSSAKTELRKRIIRDYLFKQVCIKKIIPAIKIAPESVKRVFEENGNDFIIPEKIVVTDIYFLSSKNEKKLLAYAEKVLDQLLATSGKEIKKLNLDGTYLVRTIKLNEEKDPDLYFAAWDMEPGEVSGIITASDGLHIIKVEEKSCERDMTFEEARPIILRRLVAAQYARLYESYFSKLREKAVITYPHKMPAATSPAKK